MHYSSVTDELLWPKIAADLPLELSPVFLAPRLDSSLTPLETVVVRARHSQYGDILRQAKFSSDPSTGFFVGRTVTLFNIQLATFLGLNPIFLLGIDHNYFGADARPGVITSSAGSHFHPDYRAPGETVFGANIPAMTLAYAEASTWAEKHGVSIMNASRVTALQVFPRIEFEEALRFE